MEYKRHCKKCFFIFALIFILFISMGCNKSSDTSLKPEKYTDVLGVFKDIYIVNNDGIYNLFKEGKKISKDYSYIYSLVTESSNINDNWSYFLAQDKTLNFYLVDDKGRELKLNEKYLQLQEVYENLIIFKMENLKSAFYFLNQKIEVVYDSYSKVRYSSNMFLATRKENNNVHNSLIDIYGNVIIDNVSEILPIQLINPKSSVYLYFYKVKIDDKFAIVNQEGKIVTEQTYDSITYFQVQNLLLCENTNDHKRTLINFQSEFLVISDEAYQVEMANDFFVVFKKAEEDKRGIYTFDGKVINDALTVEQKAFNQFVYYKYVTDSYVGYMNSEGLVFYKNNDLNSSLIMSSLQSDDEKEYYILRGEKFVISSNFGEAYSFNLPKDQFITNSYVPNVFQVVKENSGEVAFFSYEDLPVDVSELDYYDLIAFYSNIYITKKNDNNCIIIHDFKVNQKLSIDLLGESAPLNNIIFDSYSRIVKLKNGVTFKTMILNVLINEKGNQEYLKSSLIYWDNDKSLKILDLGSGIDYIIVNDLLVVYDKDGKSTIYDIICDENNIQIHEITTIPTYIPIAFKDGNEYYFGYKSDNFYGLLNQNGEVILNPQFDAILKVKDRKVIVYKDEHYGLLKLKKNNKYIKILDIVYESMTVFEDMLVLTNHHKETFIYNFEGKRIINERIINFEPIIYTTMTSEEEFKEKIVYKVFFGSYVMLLHYSFECSKC